MVGLERRITDEGYDSKEPSMTIVVTRADARSLTNRRSPIALHSTLSYMFRG